MSDFADRAAAAEAAFLADTLARHSLPENTNAYSHCEDCGEAIPATRRRAVKGCRKCVDCQAVAERGR